MNEDQLPLPKTYMCWGESEGLPFIGHVHLCFTSEQGKQEHAAGD